MTSKIRFYLPLFILCCLIAINQAGAVTYTLTTTTNGSGSIVKNPNNATYPANVTVTLTATPSNGWYFGGWSGDNLGTTNPLNVTMTGNLSITGRFLAYPTYSLTLATNGQGAIALSPAGGSYLSNTVVAATATPASGWVFTGWSGDVMAATNALSITVNANTALTGNFAQLPAFDVQPHSVTNAPGGTVSFTAHAVGNAPLAYQWYFNSSLLSGATGNSLMLTNTASGQAGFYQVVATNNYGSATSSVVALVLTNTSGSTNFVSVCDEPSLRAAIRAGGWISIGCSGTITLSGTIYITNHVILDAENVSATISGGNAVRLFYIAPGASLSITNLTLANGSCLITNGTAPADGGAIYNNSSVILTACTLINNQALAEITGGIARGGAIFNNGGTVSLLGSSVLNNTAFGAYNTSSSGIGFNPSGSGFGGAIFNTNGSVILLNSLLQSNQCNNVSGNATAGNFGGALFQASGAVMITNCILTANHALGGPSLGGGLSPSTAPTPAYGGALASFGGSVVLDHCQLSINTSKGGDAGGYHSYAAPAGGGAVYCAGVLTAVRSSFSGNQADGGNGSFYVGTPTATTASGGAICNLGAMTLKNCLICSNFTLGGYGSGYAGAAANGGDGLGGGVYNGASLVANNCTITGNSAIGGPGTDYTGIGFAANGNAFGGGVYNAATATFLAINITFASNFCNALTTGTASYFTNGYAAGSQIANTNGTLQLRNSLLAYGGTNGNAYGVITDLGDNISSDGSANFASGSSYNFTDPLLGPLADNGGPTLTMALLPASPAIAFADSASAPPDDQRGFARPTGTEVIDLGAYQYGASQIYYPPPTLSLAISAAATNIVVTFTTLPAITNTLHFQTSTNLKDWTDLETISAFVNPSNISRTISQQGVTRRFFRLKW